jgi:hypothetical protein
MDKFKKFFVLFNKDLRILYKNLLREELELDMIRLKDTRIELVKAIDNNKNSEYS